MSIVKYLPELPQKKRTVYADGIPLNDRAYLDDNNQFIGGGDFPILPYVMKGVTKWFYLDEYSDYFRNKGEDSYAVSFDIAERISHGLS